MAFINKENLRIILSNYIARFEELSQYDYESFKWSAANLFRGYMNDALAKDVTTENFATKF